MNEFIIMLSCGFLGGIVRGVVGVIKNRANAQPFSARHFLLSILASGIIGCFAASIIFSDFRLALLAGYAGTDMIESALKILKQQFGQRQDAIS